MTGPDENSTPDSDSGAGRGQSKTKTAGQGMKLLVDVGPVVVFVSSYVIANRTVGTDTSIFWATGAYMAAMAIALPVAWFGQRRLPPLLLMTAAIVLVMGGAAILLQSKLFAYVKPTIINTAFAVLICGAQIAGYNVWKIFFGEVFDLPEKIWRILAWRWAGWFAFLAVLNEVVWRVAILQYDNEPFWVGFKLWGVMPLTFLFALANTPLTMKWSGRTDEEYQEWLVTKAR